MEGELDAVDRERLAIPQRVDRCPAAEPRPQHELAGGGAEIAVAARAGMVGVGMGDDGAAHPPPGVDVEVALRAVETRSCEFEQIQIRHTMLPVNPEPPALLRPVHETRRLRGRQKSRRRGKDMPKAPRAFADPRSLPARAGRPCSESFGNCPNDRLARRRRGSGSRRIRRERRSASRRGRPPAVCRTSARWACGGLWAARNSGAAGGCR